MEIFLFLRYLYDKNEIRARIIIIDKRFDEDIDSTFWILINDFKN